MNETEEKLKDLTKRVGRLELKVNLLIDTVNQFNYHLTEIYRFTGTLTREQQGHSELLNKVATSGAKFKSVQIISHHQF